MPTPPQIGKPPLTEIGRVLNSSPLPGYPFTANYAMLDEDEYVADLSWPRWTRIVARMRNDPQLDSLQSGILMPIQQWSWAIDPAGSVGTSAQEIADDLGLPLLSEAAGEVVGQRRFSHFDHQRQALLALAYGHAYFEQVCEVRDGKVRLVKLATRPQRTIQDIGVKEDGGLDWLQQHGWDAPKIPVDRLTAYVWNREGANWLGRSWLRTCYQPWLVKDRLVRDDAAKHHKNAVGVPIITMPPNPTPQQRADAHQLAMAYAAGTKSGGTLPHGMELHLKGVEGGTSSPLESMKYWDEQVARVFHHMVAQLGQTRSGNRAIGETFDALSHRLQVSIAEWYQKITQEHVINDLIEWNYGTGVRAPRLVFDTRPEMIVEEVGAAIKDGSVVRDDDLENAIRAKLKVPPRSAPTPAPLSPAQLALLPGGAGTPVPFPARPGAARRQLGPAPAASGGSGPGTSGP